MPYTPLQLAEAFIQTGELTDALDALNPYLEANPGDDDARRLRAQILMRQPGDESQHAALVDWRAMAAPTRDDRFAHALTLERLNQPEAAIEGLYDLLAESPADGRVVERLLVLLTTAKRYAEGRALLNTMPKTWGWLERAGDLSSAAGRQAEAAAHYHEALDLLKRTSPAEDNAFIASLEDQLREKWLAASGAES